MFAKKIIILLAISSLASCVSTQETIPYANIPAENINAYVILSDAPVLMNTHKNGDILTLQIINISESTIVFPENFHAKIFKQENGEWLEIPQNFGYTGGDKLLPPKQSYPLGRLVTFFPNTYVPTPITIRVSIDGYLEENEQVRVGAYLDVRLNP